jgi:cysteine-rich repeat protein
VLEKMQHGTLACTLSDRTKFHYFWVYLYNGKLRTSTTIYVGVVNGVETFNQLPDQETASNSMYELGWNMVWHMETPSNFNFISFPHFSTSYLFETTARTTYQDMAQFGLNVGGFFVNNTGFVNSLQGIMHSAFIRQESMSSASIMSTWLVPRTTPSYPCDYFTGMFRNLGLQNNLEFTNLMHNYDGHSQLMTNLINAPVDPTNGISFTIGSIQSIQWVKVTEQRAIGVQFWYKGGFESNKIIVSITKVSSVKNAYLARYGNDILLKTTHDSTTVTFTGAITSLTTSDWIFVSISVGWTARNDDFVMCAYIYQAGNIDYGEWSSPFMISSTDMGNNVILYAEFGPGLIGSLKEAYVTNHLGTPHIFRLFKTSFGTQRYHCFESTFHVEPHYIINGWGNGYMVAGDAGETWDDLNNLNGDGWDSTWNTESMMVWYSDGTAGISSCGPSWGNGKLETSAGEVWDDGNTSSLDGWDSNWAVETGWICSSDSLKQSKWIPIWGDGLKLGSETCDDGSLDGIGWNDQWNGEELGWYWSDNPSAPPATTCTTVLMDGFHASPNEQCDDGNSVDIGDGWTNSGTIEPGWGWITDIMKLSHWENLWGNSKRDHVNEEWDDGNNISEDGCTNCKVDEGYQWINGLPTTMDVCYKKPTAEVSEHSTENQLTITFSEPMQNISLTSALILTITGPLSPYKFTFEKKFKNEKTLVVDISMLSQMQGNRQDFYTLSFDTTQFVSQNNVNLLTEILSGSLYKVQTAEAIVGDVGSSMNYLMGATFTALIWTNILFGQAIELIWAFMNIIQIIYFFPLLMLYFPDNLTHLLAYFSSAKLIIDLPPLEGYKTEIKTKMQIAKKIGMTSVNDRYESLEYFSTSVLLNGEDIFTIILQSFIIWVIVFALRAFFFTLQCKIADYENELDQIENKKDDETPKTKFKKLNNWFKNKIKETSREYKYNFFLRILIQLYLETAIISILNLRYLKYENGWQVLSTLVAAILVFILLSFFWWSVYFSYKNFYKFRGQPKIAIPEFESMYGQYKIENLPQALFNSFFMFRRLLYVLIIIFLPDFPVFQAFSYTLICIPILAYHLVMNPFISKLENIMMDINEITLTIWGAFFFAFSEPIEDARMSELFGWCIIGLILAVVMMNILVLWYMKISMIRKDILEYFSSMRKKKALRKSHIQSSVTLTILKSILKFKIII